MSKENEKGNPSEDSPSKRGESSALSVPESQVEQRLEAIIDAVPPPQRDEVRHTFKEFLGYVERSSPKIDPEVARIVAASNDKDNENKFKYLTRKQELEAEESKRDHAFAVTRHTDLVKMLWPIMLAVIVLVLGCIAAGIYLAATGRETLGFSILSATITAVFAYLGGLGTPYLFKGKSKE